MSNAQDLKEPWIHSEGIIWDSDKQQVCDMRGIEGAFFDATGVPQRERWRKGARIVACVGAMQGKDDPFLVVKQAKKGAELARWVLDNILHIANSERGPEKLVHMAQEVLEGAEGTEGQQGTPTQEQ